MSLSFEFRSLALTTPPEFNPDIVRTCLDKISSPGSSPLAGVMTNGSILVPAPPLNLGLEDVFSGSGFDVETTNGSSSFSDSSFFSETLIINSPIYFPLECFIITS